MANPLHVRCKSKSRVRLVRSSLRKHGEERGETDIFAGREVRSYRIMLLHALSFAISTFPISLRVLGDGVRNTQTKCIMGYVEMADTVL